MLKPSDIDTTPSDEERRAHETSCKLLESRIDAELRHARGRYPVGIGTTRGGETIAVVDEVANKYRDAGWHVTRHASGSVLMTLEPRRDASASGSTSPAELISKTQETFGELRRRVDLLRARIERMNSNIRRVCPPDMAAEIVDEDATEVSKIAIDPASIPPSWTR